MRPRLKIDGKKRSLLSLRKSQSGQAMVEYVILIILVAIVCIPVFKLLPIAVQGYVKPFYYGVSRPLP